MMGFILKKTFVGSFLSVVLSWDLVLSIYRSLSFSYKPLTKWVERYERNSPVMGSTSSSHNSAASIDVLRGQKQTPGRNRSCHLSQVNCVSIVVLQFIFPIMHGVSHCQVSSTYPW